MRWNVWLAHAAVFMALSIIVDELAAWAGASGFGRVSYWLEWATVAVGVYGIFVGLVFWCAIIVRVGRLIESIAARARSIHQSLRGNR
jgi:hypothetical protein